MSDTDAPRPALGELARTLAELAQLATAAMPTPPATNAWFTAKEFYANGYHPDFAAFLAACSPAVILQLVALATGGAETARIDDALEQDYGDLCSDLAAAQEALVLLANQLERHSVPFVPEAEAATAKARVEVARDRDLLARGMEAATDVIRAARSLTPERPADAK